MTFLYRRAQRLLGSAWHGICLIGSGHLLLGDISKAGTAIKCSSVNVGLCDVRAGVGFGSPGTTDILAAYAVRMSGAWWREMKRISGTGCHCVSAGPGSSHSGTRT